MDELKLFYTPPCTEVLTLVGEATMTTTSNENSDPYPGSWG